MKWLAPLLLALSSGFSYGIPVGEDGLTGTVQPIEMLPVANPILQSSATLKFGVSDPLDEGEQVKVSFFTPDGALLGSDTFYNDKGQAIYDCACFDVVFSQSVTTTTFTMVVESLGGDFDVEGSIAQVFNATNGLGEHENVTVILNSDVIDPPSGGITWDETLIAVGGSQAKLQGLFAEGQPWVSQGMTVLGCVDGSWGCVGDTPEGHYPIQYIRPTTLVGGEQLRLGAWMNADGGQAGAVTGNPFNMGAGYITVSPPDSEFPNRSAYSGGIGLAWWGPLGGHIDPAYAEYTAGARIAEGLSDVWSRHSSSIDWAAGIRLQGTSYGGSAALLASMQLPNLRDRVAISFAYIADTLIVKNLLDTDDFQMNKAWGTYDADLLDFRVQMPTGSLDHIWYRLHGGSQDNTTPNKIYFDPQFFALCEANKVGCLGTWHGSGHALYEDGTSIPIDLFLDANMDVRLDTVLPVFTNYSENPDLDSLRGWYNMGLSWNTSGIVDTNSELIIPLKYRQYLEDELTQDPAGKPVPEMSASATFSVTVRRPQGLTMVPGSSMSWTFGAQSGTALVDLKGEITIDNLALDTSESTYTNLRVVNEAIGDFGFVYTRSARPQVPGGTPLVVDQSNWVLATDVRRLQDSFPESDVVYRDEFGVDHVLYNCTQSEEICAAFESEVSPDATKIAFSIVRAPTTKCFGEFGFTSCDPELIELASAGAEQKRDVTAHIAIYDIATQSLSEIPNSGTVQDRSPAWINNDKIVFQSSRGQYAMIPLHGSYTGWATQYGGRYDSSNCSPLPSGACDVDTINSGSDEYKNDAHTLWTMNIDGSDAVEITPHESNAIAPYVASTGDIYYSCWQVNEDHIYDKGGPNWTGSTVANFWWICSTDQNGGDTAVNGNAHFHLPYFNTGMDGPVSDEFRSVRSFNEISPGVLTLSNYYRNNHGGFGIIYGIPMMASRFVEGQLSPVNGGANNSFYPTGIYPVTPYGQSQDAATKRTGVNGISGTDRVLGKAAYVSPGPGGRKFITHARGYCYGVLTPVTDADPDSGKMGGEPGCDQGVYELLVDSVTNPFDLSQLVPVIDSTDWNEFDQHVVAPYYSMYGSSMPVQKPAYTGDACYLNIVDAKKAEVFNRALSNSASDVSKGCGKQGCSMNPEDPDVIPNEIAYFGIFGAPNWTDMSTTGDRAMYRGMRNFQTRFIGMQPIESDGSVRAQVPCEEPFIMAGFDSDGLMVARDQMRQSLRVGEERTCHGCHDVHSLERWVEIGEVPAVDRFTSTVSAGLDPALLSVNEMLTWDDIQPIMENRCESCHGEVITDWASIAYDYWQFKVGEMGGSRAPGFYDNQGSVPRATVSNVYIDAAGTGYAAGEALNFSNGSGSGAIGSVSAVDVDGGITDIVLVQNADGGTGAGYDGPFVVTVDTASGTGAELEADGWGKKLGVPQRSKYVHYFGRNSLLYWKCVNQRTDNRADGDVSWDVDFGLSHVTDATDAECKTIARWIDQGAMEYKQ